MQQGMHMTPLAEKDLAFMEDSMAWELIAAKKAFQYAQQSMDAECRQLMLQISQQHQQNMERIHQHLSEHVTQTVQPSVSAFQPTTTTHLI